MSEKKTFFQLVEYSNELEKNQKCLRKNDPSAFGKLLKFFVTIEGNWHWEVKNKYIELIEDFLNGIISADDFSIIFMRMYEKIGAKSSQLKIALKEKNSLNSSFQSSEISKLLVKGNAYRYGMGNLLMRIYGDCDSFDLDPSYEFNEINEVQLKDSMKNALFEMQKYSDE